MNLIKLQIVVFIHRYQKITTVAEALGVKQPTVTFHMQSLEKEYGVKLFDQRAGKVMLTDAGQSLLHYATRITALAKQSERMMDEHRSPELGKLHIGASYVPGTYILPQLISQFAVLYPKVTITLTIKPASIIKEMLHEHSIDIGFISAQPAEQPDLQTTLVCNDPLVVAFAVDHPFHRFNQLPDPHVIAAEPFIVHDNSSTTRQMTMQWSSLNDVTLQHQIEFDSLEAIKRAVHMNLGITFISRIAVDEEQSLGLLDYLPFPSHHMARNIYACYHEDRLLTKRMESFLQLLDDDNRLRNT
ncbi:LysR family transcriptional regulator [Longirhabdus pacifica]|uniref:LysR family transcriptional regulator n=1 Tax=Longirhabdus pacifica TaxID=2305227 RepID=UPI0010089748|nr:LysR family transcriptional regulator [Longirhabdus pacifica]